jgi:hypothetical protein
MLRKILSLFQAKPVRSSPVDDLSKAPQIAKATVHQLSDTDRFLAAAEASMDAAKTAAKAESDKYTIEMTDKYGEAAAIRERLVKQAHDAGLGKAIDDLEWQLGWGSKSWAALGIETVTRTKSEVKRGGTLHHLTDYSFSFSGIAYRLEIERSFGGYGNDCGRDILRLFEAGDLMFEVDFKLANAEVVGETRTQHHQITAMVAKGEWPKLLSAAHKVRLTEDAKRRTDLKYFRDKDGKFRE